MSEKLFYRLCSGLTEGEFFSTEVSPYDVIDKPGDWYKSGDKNEKRRI